MNVNCLADTACPHCGQDDELDIQARVLVNVIDSGITDYRDAEYDDRSPTTCPMCGHTAQLGTFRKATQLRTRTITAPGDHVTVVLDPSDGKDPSARVEVELYLHQDTGFVVLDIDANGGANIDVDVHQYTALIVRDGEVDIT